MATEILRPNATGSITHINISGYPNTSPNEYLNIDEVTADDAATYIFGGSGSMVEESYNLSNTALTTETITSVKVYFRVCSSSAANPQLGNITTSAADNYIKPSLYLSGNTSAGTRVSTASGWKNLSETISRPGGGSWTVDDLDDLEVIIGLESPTGYAVCTQVYVEVTYTSVETGNAVFFGTNF
jgi:hypothetical protein